MFTVKTITIRAMISSLLGFLCLLSAGCSPGSHDRLGAAVSVLPQKYLVERIAGDRVTVAVMIPPGFSHESTEITPGQIKALSRARVYFRLGPLPFEEANMDRLTQANPALKVVDTSAGVALLGGHHGADPHLWLSPPAMTIMARHIRDALVELDPAGKSIYDANFKALAADMDILDRRISTMLASYKGRKFLVFHPAWSYFAQRYGLTQVAVEHEGKSPGPQHMKNIIDLARKEKIRVIFIQRQYSSAAAATVAGDLGGKVKVLDPLDPDWPAMMNTTAEAIRDALDK